MNVAVAITATILAVLYLVIGGMKLVLPISLIPAQMEWAHIATPWQVRAVGTLSVLGAIGVVLPVWLGILPWFAVAAAIGLVLLQVGAIITHIRMGGDAVKSLPFNTFLLLLAAFTAVGYIITI
ncbi:DoxX family protein [Subtercola endophyticus]|uniref:DoxX family protein n=1 Tax=Subtercola endophyticus TaxID=2895559 RepID=UPI001E4722B5|nr:DoxX family protein [Subtercola endophyticus]UFS58181.1 DoxX family protein [Subtercola endophyticus]